MWYFDSFTVQVVGYEQKINYGCHQYMYTHKMLSQISLIHLFCSAYYHNVQGLNFSLPLLASHIILQTWHFILLWVAQASLTKVGLTISSIKYLLWPFLWFSRQPTVRTVRLSRTEAKKLAYIAKRAIAS